MSEDTLHCTFYQELKHDHDHGLGSDFLSHDIFRFLLV